MFSEHVDNSWVDAFADVFSRCNITPDESVVLLTEDASRSLLVQTARLALGRLGLAHFTLHMQTVGSSGTAILRSTGASQVLNNQSAAVHALCQSDVVIDLTLEGLMHAPQTAEVLRSGARILTVSNEHPEALARLVPCDDDKRRVREAVARCKAAGRMDVTSDAGTELHVDMRSAVNVGVWGWTDRPGTLAHWPAGLVVSFPAAGAVDGRLVLAPGDMNLTFKRYVESAVTLTIESDYVTAVEGSGVDARLMRDYFASFGDREAYATSHVGWGLNPAARYEALTMYDRNDCNGTELRALAGNFLYSTGANEHAGRFTEGHFDLPVLGCDILLDGEAVVTGGVPVASA